MAASRILVDPTPLPYRNQPPHLAAIHLLIPRLFLFVPLAVEGAARPTQTSLMLSTQEASAGQAVALAAPVIRGGLNVTVGTVTCLNGTQVLGIVQVIDNGGLAGTATLKTRFAPGTSPLNAQSNSTNLFRASQSGPQQLIVTGVEPTITTLTDQPDGNKSDYTTTVFGFAFVTPVGQVKFDDLTCGFLIGTVALAGPGMSTFQAARLILPLHRGGERRVAATLMSVCGTGFLWLVFPPVRLRSKAAAALGVQTFSYLLFIKCPSGS